MQLPQPNKDSGHVDGFQTATTEDRHRGNTSDVVNRSHHAGASVGLLGYAQSV